MNMHDWLNTRCAQLLKDLNDTHFTDDCEEVKMKLLMSAMRESSVEMFHRAAENSRKEIDNHNNAEQQATAQSVKTEEEQKPVLKIKFKSAIIRQ